MPYQVLQYQIKAEPIPLGAIERSTPDKWSPEIPDSPIRRASSFAALVSSVAFVPVISASATPVYVNSQACEPIKVEHVQYQAKAEPVLVPSPAGETVTSDKWDRGQSQPLARVKRAAEYAAWVTANSSLLAPERSDLDKWVVRIEQPRRDPKRQQYSYPSFFGERLHNVPSTAAIYVGGQSCDPIGVVWFQYPADQRPVFTPSAAPEVVTLDKWAQRLPDRIARVKPLADYSQFSIDPTLRAESASLDKWGQPVSQPRSDSKRVQYLYRSFTGEKLFVVPGVETITLDKWFSQRPEQVFTNKRLKDYSLFIVDLRQLTVPERSQLDKWGQPQSEPRIATKRRAVYIPTNDPPLALAQPVSQLITWNQPQAVPLRTLKWPQALYPPIDAAFFLSLSGADFLSPSKDIDSVILLTVDNKAIALTVLDVDSVSAVTADTDSITIVHQDVDSL